MASRRRGMTVLSYLIALTALCVALSYVDAVATVHARAAGPIDAAGATFTPGALEELTPREIALEQTRQAAIVLLLITIAFIAGRNGLQQWGTFVFTLGGWAMLRYAVIRTLVDWPRSLGDTDTVFLLQEPISAPVWMPVVAGLGLVVLGVTLIRAGALVLRRRRST